MAGIPAIDWGAGFLNLQEDGTYAVFDTKLARSAKADALLQLAAYADQLRSAGVPVHREAHLVLGTNETTTHDLTASAALFDTARNRIRGVLEAHRLRPPRPCGATRGGPRA